MCVYNSKTFHFVPLSNHFLPSAPTPATILSNKVYNIDCNSTKIQPIYPSGVQKLIVKDHRRFRSSSFCNRHKNIIRLNFEVIFIFPYTRQLNWGCFWHNAFYIMVHSNFCPALINIELLHLGVSYILVFHVTKRKHLISVVVWSFLQTILLALLYIRVCIIIRSSLLYTDHN